MSANLYPFPALPAGGKIDATSDIEIAYYYFWGTLDLYVVVHTVKTGFRGGVWVSWDDDNKLDAHLYGLNHAFSIEDAIDQLGAF